jgi:GNAT superfamily N-acetyltransferase
MKEATEIAIAAFSQRPDLLDKVFGTEIQSAVPEFMRHDPAGALYYGNGQIDHHREFGLVAVDLAEPDRPIARAFSVPFAFRDGTSEREELPDGGWDAVIRWAYEDRLTGRPATAVSALEIMVAPRLQRRAVSRLMLAALRDNARRLGFADLYGPLRPTDKHREPLTPFADYGGNARTACLTIRGYAPMFGPVRRSSRSRRAAWSSPERSPNGGDGPGSASPRAGRQSCRAPCH